MRRLAGVLVAVALAAPAAGAGHVAEPVCIPTPRLPHANPEYAAERAAFGFHDEELVLCSPGHREPTHLAARMFVPAECPGTGRCAGVLVAHGFGFAKEVTLPDMQTLARRGFYVLSYDVRGQGASGGHAGMMGREEIADQAAVLGWFHANVRPRKVGVYGISQGGSLAFMAAIFTCGSARAAHFGSTISCDAGKRWVHAIAPVQAPRLDRDGTCAVFMAEAIAESRINLELTRSSARCLADGTPAEGLLSAATAALPRFDYGLRNFIAGLGRIDVPAYLTTGFYDRLVLPQNTTDAYETLRARVNDPLDPYKEDVRLLISNDAHGTVGSNFAVLNDIFDWLEWQLKGSIGPRRDAPVAIAQEWAGNAFRLEEEWPIPESSSRAFYLSRPPGSPTGQGVLRDSPPTGEPADRLRNVPVVSSPPDVPFVSGLPLTDVSALPGSRLVYRSDPMPTTIEITGTPRVSLWVSSTNGTGEGMAQFHIALSEVAADGSVTEFARYRRGVRSVGRTPVEVAFPLTVSSHRIDAGNRLVVTITPSDVGVSTPFVTPDVTLVHHDAAHPSAVVVPLAPVDRVPPAGAVPTGPAFPGQALEAICEGLGIPCPD